MRWGRLATANYRGARVPRVLGFVLLAAGAAWTLADALLGDVGAEGWGALAGLSSVFAAGLIDDLVPIGPRGLRGHLRSLLEGHMTTGILKMLVITASAVIVVTLLPTDEAWVRVAGVVLVAACANLWNGLDVRPGRALKASLLPGLAFVIWGDTADLPAVTGVVVGAAAVLPLDLRETAMLGDGGANLLGFAVGLGLYDLLAGAWVPIAAGVAVGLNVVAETVTLSRAIDAVPALRWFDRLGRPGT
jgi:hypothetical protein